MTPRLLRTLGLVACLLGVLVMIAARFGSLMPATGVWVGLAVIVVGWALLALSILRRPRDSNP
jgi:hypothetical protein